MNAPVAAVDPVRQVEQLSEQNLWACYQCGRCTADCPFSLTPNLVVRLLQLGKFDDARSLATTWDCAACYTCAAGCPKGVSPTRVIKALRAMKPNGKTPNKHLSVLNGTAHTQDNFSTALALRPLPDVGFRGWLARVRARIMALAPTLFWLGSWFAPLSNWLLRIPGGGWMAQLFLGVHHRRQLPEFARKSFPAWFKKHEPLGDGKRGKVLLFHDEFMDYNYPQTGIAATELLEKAGFEVELTDNVCCGRPAISKGITDRASNCATENVSRLFEKANEGIYIVGCEPSCLLSFRDEYEHLVPEEMAKDARVVGRQAYLIDEFLAMLLDKGELDLKFELPEDAPKLLFHGHCHQKAFAHPEKCLELLEHAGYCVDYVNAACCGMAGMHGFEHEHYEASKAACERALLPAMRAEPDAELVVMGVSCRQQVEHFDGRLPRHFVEALRDAVVFEEEEPASEKKPAKKASAKKS